MDSSKILLYDDRIDFINFFYQRIKPGIVKQHYKYIQKFKEFYKGLKSWDHIKQEVYHNAKLLLDEYDDIPNDFKYMNIVERRTNKFLWQMLFINGDFYKDLEMHENTYVF